MNQLHYHEQKDRENIRKLRSMIQELPPFCPEFFRGIEPQTSSRTRIAYAYDLRIFFDILCIYVYFCIFFILINVLKDIPLGIA